MGECGRKGVGGMVLAAKAGDRSACEALVVRFRPTALLVARGVCNDAELAEDAVQDAFLVALRSLDGLDEPSRFGPWLATIVRNRTRRLAQSGDRARSVPLDMAERELLSLAPSLAHTLPERGEEAVRALPDGIRESMLLYYFEDWSVGEIAALLERPVTTVKWQLHAGRSLLRKRLASEKEPDATYG